MSQPPDEPTKPWNQLESRHERRRRRRQRASSALVTLFIIAGSLFNLLALVLLATNLFTLSRVWLSGQSVSLGADLLAPFGAFLIGLLCFGIAWTMD